MLIFAPVWIPCRILKAVKKVLNKGGFKKSDVSIISAFTIRQTPVESRDLNSPSSRWWEVDRGAFFATIQLKYSYIVATPIIMDVDFTAPSHLLRLQFVLGCFFPWTFRAVANISRKRVAWNLKSSINDFYDAFTASVTLIVMIEYPWVQDL